MTTTSIAPQMARRIEIWPIERLVPYLRNARTHAPEQVAQIAASIVEFGFDAPILVASDAGIVAGHGHLLAARKLGLAEVPVVVLDHLSETQRRAYIIADNKLALNAGRDEKMLRIELVFTDPPYNVDYVGKTAKKLKIGNDALAGKFYEFLRDASANLLAVTKGAIYVCMSSSELHTLFQAFSDAGGHWSTFVIWAKHHFTLVRSDYQRMYEPIRYGWRDGTQHFWCGDRNQGDVWFIKQPMANLEHPTVKPVELVERALRNSSKTRDTILDPFGGSGTTMIACEKAGRLARLIELEPRYCDVAIRRWQEYTGGIARHADSGRAFDDLAAGIEGVAHPASHQHEQAGDGKQQPCEAG